MNLPKLISLLETQSLYFARADTLGDPFEGTLAIGNKFAREVRIKKMVEDGEHIQNPKVKNTEMDLRKMFENMTQEVRQYMYVNCWHAGETENAAMWKLYGTTEGAVVIQTTYEKLASALPENTYMDEVSAGPIYMGMVQYKDYWNVEDFIPTQGNAMSPFIHKRREFEHEKEVRAVTMTTEGFKKEREGTPIYNPRGIRANIDLEQLIETIRIQPATPIWVKQTIEALLKKYGWGLKITQSNIDLDPLY